MSPEPKDVVRRKKDSVSRRSNALVDDAAAPEGKAPNPVWFKPLMFGFMLLGLAWIIVFYISGGQWPIAAIANWNILVGFGILIIGFLMTTRWR